MRSTFSLLPYINRSKVKADGTTAVLCRITIDGKQTVISPGIYCRPEDWNGRKNEIKSARENNRLREYLRLMEEAYNEILKSQGVVSAEMLKNHITLNNIHPTTLLQMGGMGKGAFEETFRGNRLNFFLSEFNVLPEVPDKLSHVFGQERHRP